MAKMVKCDKSPNMSVEQFMCLKPLLIDDLLWGHDIIPFVGDHR